MIPRFGPRLRRLRPSTSRWRRIEWSLFAALLAALAYWVWNHPPSSLQLTLFRDELRVVLVADAGAVVRERYVNPNLAYEQELFRRFADEIGTRVRFERVGTPEEARIRLASRRADAAAGLLVPVEATTPGVRNGPNVLPIERVIAVWNAAPNRNERRTLNDVRSVGLLRGTPRGEAVLQQNISDPDLVDLDATVESIERPMPDVQPFEDLDELIQALRGGIVDAVLMHSIDHARLSRQHPELTVIERLPETGAVWWFSNAFDASLAHAAERFLARLGEEDELERLIDQYFGHLGIHGLIDSLTLQRHIQTRLPPLEPYFRSAANDTGIDWRLLAALGYQESQWDPEALSPTGVRGVMMLTRATADEVGVENRRDPEQSIAGGARYLRGLIERIPESVPEEDRLLFALASYNVGFGHVLEARRLAAENGADPNSWLTLTRWLPRLADREWYSQTAYGYARGWEPVHLVTSVRSYHDWLRQIFPDDALGPPPSTSPKLPTLRTL